MTEGKRILETGADPGAEARTDSRRQISEMRARLVQAYYSFLQRYLKYLLNSGISANFITVSALLFSIIAAYCLSLGKFFAGAAFLIVAGFLDTMDGSFARLKGQTSLYGALLDSTLDRYSEFCVFFGLLIYFRNDWIFFFLMLALLGSVMVSYIKARAQSLGNWTNVGLMQRPERLGVIVFACLLNPLSPVISENSPDLIFKSFMVLLAVLTNLTAVGRLRQGKKDLA